MAVWQIESDACTGRGFAAVDADGICANFFTYVTKLAAAGGPAWTILRDMSATPAGQNFNPADVSNPGGVITLAGHGYVTGDRVIFSTTNALPPEWTAGTTYYVTNAAANTFEIASTLANAYAGTNIDVTGIGAGVHTVVLDGPYIIVSDNASPAINEVCFVIKVGYLTLEAGYIRVQQFLGWDDVNKIAIGVWDGRRIHSVDAGPFAYDFRGGAQGMIIQSRIGVDWDTIGVDSFTGSVNFLEAATVVTDLTAPAVAGLAVSLAVTDSSAFSAGHYYYIYDLATQAIVNYVYCTGCSDGTHIEVTELFDNMTAGAIIGAYPHRFYTFGTADQNNLFDMNFSATYRSKIPYCSAADGYVFHAQTNYITGGIAPSSLAAAITTHDPGDDGFYAVQKGFIYELYRENDFGPSSTGMNRAYGVCNNVYLTANTGLAKAQDGRTIGGSNYLYFQLDTESFCNGSSLCALLLDTEALV